MKFTPTNLDGVFVSRVSQFCDDRGHFVNLFRRQDHDYAAVWSNQDINQVNISFNIKAGTLRGIHYQTHPFIDSKIVICLEGSIFDVALDINKESPTYGKWISFILSDKSLNMIVIPGGYAHGFQTLQKNTKVLYLHSQIWSPTHEAGYHYLSTSLKIPWPIPVSEISDKDLSLPHFF